MVAVVLVGILIAGCGSSGSSAAAANAAAKRAQSAVSAALTPGSSAPPGVATTLVTKPSKFKVRFFNDLVLDGQPGPSLDIYDTLAPSLDATKLPKGVTPLVKALKYGQFSDYVVPRGLAGLGGDGEVGFTTLMSGKSIGPDNEPASADGMAIGNSAPQETIVYSAGDDGSMNHGLNGITYSDLIEKAGGTQGDAPPATAPSGQAVFALNTSTIPKADSGGGTFFFVDDSCTPPLNGSPGSTTPDIFTGGGSRAYGPYPFFATTPGSHQLAVTFWPQNTEATCDQVKPTAAQATVDADADTVYMTIPYGVDAQHIQIATGAIAK